MREITSSKMVVLATKKTIQSHLYEQPNCIGIACPKFVKYLENNPNHDCKKAIHHYLKKHQDAQTLVLGCTHYQLLKEEIVRYFQHPIKIIDSSEEIANQLSIKNSSLQIDLYVTKINDKIKKNIAIILQGFTYQIHLLDEPIH